MTVASLEIYNMVSNPYLYIFNKIIMVISETKLATVPGGGTLLGAQAPKFYALAMEVGG